MFPPTGNMQGPCLTRLREHTRTPDEAARPEALLAARGSSACEPASHASVELPSERNGVEQRRQTQARAQRSLFGLLGSVLEVRLAQRHRRLVGGRASRFARV